MRLPAQRLSPVAETLCRIVAERPGIHFRGLCRAAQLRSVGQLRHHVDRLRARGALVEIREGQFKRFFLPGQYDASLMPTLARFSRRTPRLIGLLLLERPMRRTELRRQLRCADSTLGYHLKRLVLSGDVRRVGPGDPRYTLAEPELFRGLLEPGEARPLSLYGRRTNRRPVPHRTRIDSSSHTPLHPSTSRDLPLEEEAGVVEW